MFFPPERPFITSTTWWEPIKTWGWRGAILHNVVSLNMQDNEYRQQVCIFYCVIKSCKLSNSVQSRFAAVCACTLAPTEMSALAGN